MTPPEITFTQIKKADSLKTIDQVHGDALIEVKDLNHLAALRASPPQADGLWTKATVPLEIRTADCVPVLIYSNTSSVIAAVHSGWRGTARSIAAKAFKAVLPHGSDFTAVLGPSIGTCCFEVKQDLLDIFESAKQPVTSFIVRKQGVLTLDLVGVIRQQLERVHPIRVDLSRHCCTVCSLPRLPSYRRDHHTDVLLTARICRE